MTRKQKAFLHKEVAMVVIRMSCDIIENNFFFVTEVLYTL
jgi:hypothetical protein